MGHAFLKQNRAVSLSGSITYLTGTSLPFTGEDVLSFYGQAGVRNGLLPGAVLACQCSLLLYNGQEKFTAGLSPYGAKVQVLASAGEETHPLAVFYVSGVSMRDGSAYLTLTGADALGSGLEHAWQDSLSYPCTLGQIAAQVVQQGGLSLSGDFPLKDQVIQRRPDWGEISLRGVLSHVAMACGCFCRMDGEGKLRIQPAWNAGETPYEIFPENTFKREFGDASFGPLKGLSVSLHGAKRNDAPLIVQADDTPLDAFNSLSIANNPLFSAEDASAPGRIRQLLNALE
ncbi:MAG: hypothetical protein IJN44_01495, partial [Clostridia bacterium]|nr:hypothetical protein [Clostridia bacterium]